MNNNIRPYSSLTEEEGPLANEHTFHGYDKSNKLATVKESDQTQLIIHNDFLDIIANIFLIFDGKSDRYIYILL
jgi:hypothetical protein